MQKFRGFVAVFMLIMTFTLIHGFYIGDDDYHLPDAPKSEAQMYFDTIPEEERDEFIRYFLGKGLRMKENFEPYNTKAKAAGDIGNIEIVYGPAPANFAPTLVDYFSNEFDLDHQDIQTIAEDPSEPLPAGCYPKSIGCLLRYFENY